MYYVSNTILSNGNGGIGNHTSTLLPEYQVYNLETTLNIVEVPIFNTLNYSSNCHCLTIIQKCTQPSKKQSQMPKSSLNGQAAVTLNTKAIYMLA